MGCGLSAAGELAIMAAAAACIILRMERPGCGRTLLVDISTEWRIQMDYGNMSASKIKRYPSFDGYLFGGNIFNPTAANGIKTRVGEHRKGQKGGLVCVMHR